MFEKIIFIVTGIFQKDSAKTTLRDWKFLFKGEYKQPDPRGWM